MVFLVIAVFHADIHDAGQAAAEAGRKTALVKRHVLDGIGVEHREETQHVIDIINRDAVEQQQVLIGSAATYIKAGRAFRTGLHARQQLDGLDYVHLAGQRRHMLDLVYGNLDGAHLRSADAQFGSRSRDSRTGQHLCGRLEGHMDDGIALEPERSIHGFIADVRPFQGYVPGR